MHLTLIIASISSDDRKLLVQRHLTYTVNGVFGVIHHLWHTVLSTLHHHAATEHTAEVGTLDGVQDTTGIDGADTVLKPICWIRFFSDVTIAVIFLNDYSWIVISCVIGKQRQDVISCQR